MAPMTKLICRGMCNFKKYIMIKGFDYQRARSLGTRTLTGAAPLRYNRGSKNKSDDISLDLVLLAMNFCGDKCKHTMDMLY